MEQIQKIIDLIDASIAEDPEMNIMWWWIIADWYNTDVDHYRWLVDNSKDWLSNYQSQLIETYWLSSLKVKYTNASWYFIEIPKSQVAKIPDSFIHKQTLVNASRFITIELKEFEQQIMEAQWLKAEKEYEIFLNIRETILDSFDEIKQKSDVIAYLDFISGLSKTSLLYDYVKPKVNKKYDFNVIWWRHPVIEQSQNDFISNDLSLTQKEYVHIITGPNMWWKSTFLRQNALILLLAHIWSFVPAKQAELPLSDKIFSRVWAQDNLYLWQSTFMVEMQEVANILNNSTKNSFVIIDEVWRWTSTYDGMSIAWAILKEIHDSIQAKTLFATHYHELIDESNNLSGVKNFSVAVWEDGENLVFLRKIIAGWIKKSFWLEVAKIAWLSQSTLSEAKKMLKMLELEHNKISGTQMLLWAMEPEVKIIEKEVMCNSKIEQELKNIDINNLTPLQALDVINDLQWKIKS